MCKKILLCNKHYLTIHSSSDIICVRWMMDTQFKKVVLELLVLIFASKKDRYGYELVEEISKVVNVNEGTIYPILKRLTNENYFETYLKESTGGPSRKYYKLTVLGEKRKNDLLEEWKRFESSVNAFIKESENGD